MTLPFRSPIAAITAITVLLAWVLAAAMPRPVHAAEPVPKAFWYQGRIVVAVKPRANEGYILIAERVMEHPDRYGEIVAFNGNRPTLRGRSVRFPISSIKLPMRGAILRAMYPDDELTEKGWAHSVTDSLETLIQLTEAFTGSKRRFKELARLNRIGNANVLRAGTVITIPLKWIPRELGFQPTSVRKPLRLVYDRGTGRTFATYTLRKNETLYSVILRFTERDRAEEVVRMAGIMLKLNGIRRVDRVPAGRPMRMPVEWLSPEFLGKQAMVRRYAPPPPKPAYRSKAGIGPVHVIIDPGHGGVDPGAVYGSRKKGDQIYEHEVVFDIALRLSGLLHAKGYRTHMTVKDRAQAMPVRRISTSRLGGEKVQVTPPYLIRSDHVGVNMRVFLIDALYRRLTGKGKVRPDRIILVSIHGDALAPTLRGCTVYFPDHRLRLREFRPRGKVYRRRREAVPAVIRFTQKAAREAHWASKQFGERIISSLKAAGIRVGGRRPVRSYYYRDGERALPAVLRYSRIPTSVLVEVGNLNNPHDRRAILHNKTRQRIAQGLADAIRKYRSNGGKVALSRRAG